MQKAEKQVETKESEQGSRNSRQDREEQSRNREIADRTGKNRTGTGRDTVTNKDKQNRIAKQMKLVRRQKQQIRTEQEQVEIVTNRKINRVVQHNRLSQQGGRNRR